MASQRRNLEWLAVVVGTILSAALGGLLYFETDLNAAFAALAGLIGITVSLQVEMLLRWHKGQRDQRDRDRFLGQLKRHPELSEFVKQGVAALDGVAEQGAPIVVQLAEDSLDQCLESLQDLQRGYLKCSMVRDDRLMQRLTENAGREMIATSIDQDDLRWWDTPPGVAYLNVQQRAVARGVTIKRIFICKEWTHDHDLVLADQRRRGIKTFRVDVTSLPSHLWMGVVLWDEISGLEHEYLPNGQVKSVRYTFEPGELERIKANCRVIEEMATEVIGEIPAETRPAPPVELPAGNGRPTAVEG